MICKNVQVKLGWNLAMCPYSFTDGYILMVHNKCLKFLLLVSTLGTYFVEVITNWIFNIWKKKEEDKLYVRSLSHPVSIQLTPLAFFPKQNPISFA